MILKELSFSLPPNSTGYGSTIPLLGLEGSGVTGILPWLLLLSCTPATFDFGLHAVFGLAGILYTTSKQYLKSHSRSIVSNSLVSWSVLTSFTSCSAPRCCCTQPNRFNKLIQSSSHILRQNKFVLGGKIKYFQSDLCFFLSNYLSTSQCSVASLFPLSHTQFGKTTSKQTNYRTHNHNRTLAPRVRRRFKRTGSDQRPQLSGSRTDTVQRRSTILGIRDTGQQKCGRVGSVVGKEEGTGI